MASREIIDLVRRYIILLNSEGLSIEKAFLFGSYTKNTATEKSDIDVLIISDKFDENDDLAIGKTWRLTGKINTRIEPFLISSKKFMEDETSPLIADVKTHGIEITF